MAEYLTRDIKLAISALPESPYNAMKTAAADEYLGMLTTARNIYIPDKEKLDDTGKVGTGREFPTEQRSGYVTVPSLEISEELNVAVAALLLRRAMGGADTPSGTSPAPITHTWAILGNDTVAGRQLPSSSIVWSVGGADYLWGGVVVESFTVEQTGAAVPTFTAGLVGSGLFKRLRNLTANGALATDGNAYTGPYPHPTNTSAFPPQFPAPTDQKYMLGAETQLQFNDGSLYVVTGAQRLKGFSATLTNNHRTDDRRPGDPRVNSVAGNQLTGDPRQGHYVNRMLHGDRTVGAEMTVMLDDTMREFSDAYNDTVITSFLYKARGNFLTDGITQSSFGLTFPKCYFRSVRGADDAGDAVVTIAIFPVDNAGTGPMTATIVNDNDEVIA